MNLCRLIYTSDRVEVTDESGLKDISRKSESKNAEHNITGLLVTVENSFIQVLEGPIPEVNSLYQAIVKDPRHRNPRLISYTIIPERHFLTWSMKGVDDSTMDQELATVLAKKYGDSEGKIDLLNDPWRTYSFLYDVYCNAKDS